MILVPGNSWTGARSWALQDYNGESNAKGILTIKDPLDNWAIEIHQYLDQDFSGTHKQVVSATTGSERLKNFVNWCRHNHMHAVLGEFAVPDVPMGEAALNDLLQSMEHDSDVWLGWTWWAAGSRWGNYMFTLEPKNGQDQPQMVWLRPHLAALALPKSIITVKNGDGQGCFEACTIQSVAAAAAPSGMVFKIWIGDTIWLKNPELAKTAVTIPFKDIQIEATYEKAP